MTRRGGARGSIAVSRQPWLASVRAWPRSPAGFRAAAGPPRPADARAGPRCSWPVPRPGRPLPREAPWLRPGPTARRAPGAPSAAPAVPPLPRAGAAVRCCYRPRAATRRWPPPAWRGSGPYTGRGSPRSWGEGIRWDARRCGEHWRAGRPCERADRIAPGYPRFRVDEHRKKQLQEFVAYAKTLDGDEKGEAQVFLDRLFRGFSRAGYKEAGATLEMRVKNDTGS